MVKTHKLKRDNEFTETNPDKGTKTMTARLAYCITSLFTETNPDKGTKTRII